jgi:hypothetical protein
MLFNKQNPDLEKLADLLASGTVALFAEREVQFSKPPTKTKEKIFDYEGKMRADGMEKFNNEPTYVSAVNYYATPADMGKKKALGALIVYVAQDYIATLMKHLKYPPVDDENENAMLDSCGTLGNIIAGHFKSEIASAGHIELEMSHFVTYRNAAVVGIDFCRNEFSMYRLEFEIDGKKRLVLEMTLGPVPKRS